MPRKAPVSVAGGRDGAAFRKRLIALCLDQGLTWEAKPSMRALAIRCNVAESVVRRWFQVGTPSLAHLARIASTFGVSVDWLVTGRDPGSSGARQRADPVYVSRSRSNRTLGEDLAQTLLEHAQEGYELRERDVNVLAGELRDASRVIDLVVALTLPELLARVKAAREDEVYERLRRVETLELQARKATSPILKAMLAPGGSSSALEDVVSLLSSLKQRKPPKKSSGGLSRRTRTG